MRNCLYVVPNEGELLSSWLIRLVLNTHSYATDYFSLRAEQKDIWYKDIDRSLTPELLFFLSNHTPYSTDEISELSLTSYNGYIFENDNPNAINKWIRQLSFIGRKPTGCHIYYCPLCLTREKQYYRKIWRIKFYNVCIQCGIYLESKCQKCLSPIHFFRPGVGNQKLYSFSLKNCPVCEYDLTTIIPKDAPHRLIDSSIEICRTLETGYHDHFGHSFIYFDCLYQVNKVITKHLNVAEQVHYQAKTTHLAWMLLEEFPDRIVKLSINRKISKTPWLRDFCEDRFLFTDEITKRLSKVRKTQFC